ncbi:hypothetical protein DPMN_103727 [Dreissena polymorpha]|uniref:Uncharacterized protein n=1 Tax=Dreissena polymorpha TaxID=45954 RepID=A0A9D4H8E7_DREPO|nr:hypothetical protein DPMN_103727 [Dreissena polymorpha]
MAYNFIQTPIGKTKQFVETYQYMLRSSLRVYMAPLVGGSTVRAGERTPVTSTFTRPASRPNS